MPGGVEHRRKPRWFWGNWLWLTSTVTLHFHTTIVPASLSGLPHWFLLLITRRTMVGRVVCFFASHHIHSPADSVSCRMLNNWTKWGNHSSPAALQMLAQCWVLTVFVASTLPRHPCHRWATLTGLRWPRKASSLWQFCKRGLCLSWTEQPQLHRLLSP